MRRSIVLAAICGILVITISGDAQPLPENPICGLDEVLANRPERFRRFDPEPTLAFRSSEILLYLHFDGAVVMPGFDNAGFFRSSLVSGSRSCPASTATQAQQDETVRLVRDDFSPFNIRVTTDFDEFLAYPAGYREMVLITTFPSVAGFSSGTGGVSPFTGGRIPNSLSFVFSSLYGNDPKGVAHTISHEAGHQFGLDHQNRFDSSCSYLAEYDSGYGSGPLSFDPIMGSGLDQGITNWFAQSCPSRILGRRQNDYEVLSSEVFVRDDDFPNVAEGAVQSSRDLTGILEQAGDVDFMRISFKNPGPVTISSDNIDLRVSIFNPGGKLLGTYNDPDSPGVTIPSANGMRYLKIEAASNENMSSQFMIGTYRVQY